MQQDAEAYKAQVTALAEGQTARFLELEQAYSQSPEVTRKRLYKDTIENVLARAHKVLIDTKTGNGGNMLYLPLDKLLERANSRDDTAQTAVITGRDESGANSAPKQQEPDSVTVEARGRGDR